MDRCLADIAQFFPSLFNEAQLYELTFEKFSFWHQEVIKRHGK